jgi:16S rRNA (cytosine967-C5)-methyltransferase
VRGAGRQDRPAGRAGGHDEPLVAAEVAFHRALLVRQAVRAYPSPPAVVVADGTRPAWRPGAFARVLVDAPCTGLGALRRRPESRWRRQPADVEPLHRLQLALLATAIDSTAPGGVVGYVTCSPHRRETVDVVAETLADATT